MRNVSGPAADTKTALPPIAQLRAVTGAITSVRPMANATAARPTRGQSGRAFSRRSITGNRPQSTATPTRKFGRARHPRPATMPAPSQQRGVGRARAAVTAKRVATARKTSKVVLRKIPA
jgi:hypothetical protein